MTSEDRTEIKSRILVKIRRTKADIVDLVELTKPIPPENAIGRVSRMDAINNKSVNEAALRSAQGKLGALEKALLKVEDTNFGMCAKCEEPIQVPRLKFMPESIYCMKCAR